mgnify:CR=1 FL=1
MKTRPQPYRLAVLAAVALLLFMTIAASAQKENYPWMELPRKDAERLLTNSPWSHTQSRYRRVRDVLFSHATGNFFGGSIDEQRDGRRSAVDKQQSRGPRRC